MAPPAVLDYVAAHECAHLLEMNHSPRFWAHVERCRCVIALQPESAPAATVVAVDKILEVLA